MKTVVGLFENYMDAERAVSDLNARGFGKAEVQQLESFLNRMLDNR